MLVLLYLHYFALFLLAAQNVFMLALFASRVWPAGYPSTPRRLHQDVSLRNWTIAQLVVGASFAPWTPIFLQQIRVVQDGFWIQTPTIKSLATTFLMFLGVSRPPFGEDYVGIHSRLPVLPGTLTLGWLFGILCRRLYSGVARTAAVSTDLNQSSSEISGIRREQALPMGWLVFFLVLWLVVPVVVPWILSQGTASAFTPRNTIVAAPALLLLLGLGVFWVNQFALRLLFLGMLIAPSVNNYQWYYFSPHKEQWREAAAWIVSRAKHDDQFTVEDWYRYSDLLFYAPDISAGQLVRSQFDPRPVRSKPPAPAERLWLVLNPTTGLQRIERAEVLKGDLRARGYHLKEHRGFTSIDVQLWAQ
jgi:hypothetical protein